MSDFFAAWFIVIGSSIAIAAASHDGPVPLGVTFLCSFIAAFFICAGIKELRRTK